MTSQRLRIGGAALIALLVAVAIGVLLDRGGDAPEFEPSVTAVTLPDRALDLASAVASGAFPPLEAVRAAEGEPIRPGLDAAAADAERVATQPCLPGSGA
jgi:hypothetical protein